MEQAWRCFFNVLSEQIYTGLIYVKALELRSVCMDVWLFDPAVCAVIHCHVCHVIINNSLSDRHIDSPTDGGVGRTEWGWGGGVYRRSETVEWGGGEGVNKRDRARMTLSCLCSRAFTSTQLADTPLVFMRPSCSVFLSICTDFYSKCLSRPAASAANWQIDCDKYAVVRMVVCVWACIEHNHSI